MDNNNKENSLETLLRRRNKLMALAEYHRKTPPKTSTVFQPLDICNHDLQAPEVGSSPINETAVQARQSNSSDFIENSDAETSQQNVTIFSSSNDSINTSTISFPLSHLYFRNGDDNQHQTSPLKIINDSTIPCDPNKKIKLISSIIIRRPTTYQLPEKVPDLKTAPVGVEPTNLHNNYEDQDAAYSHASYNLPACVPISTTAPVCVSPSILHEICEDIDAATAHPSYQLPAKEPEPKTAPVGVEPTNLHNNYEDQDAAYSHASYNLPACVPISTTAPVCVSPSILHEISEDIDAATAHPSYQLPAKEPEPKTAPVGVAPANWHETYEDLDAANSHVYQLPPKLPAQKTHETCEDLCAATFSENTSAFVLDSNIIENNRKRRRNCSKKTFMDFLSDDEKQDFSSGSSDNWSNKESISNSDTGEENNSNEEKRKKKQKLVKKETEIRKKEKKINNRKIRKTLKDEGKSYESRKGTNKPEKSLKPNPCVLGKCARGCFDITEERRTELFNFFWKLDSQRRRDWILRCAHSVPVKRRKIDSSLSRRNATYEYYINNGDDHKQVCQKFLMMTLDITQKYLIYTISKSKEGMAQDDRRKPNAVPKYSDEAKTNAKKFIEKLPAVPSHYNRQRTNKTYLPQELKNISNLYRIYIKECTVNNQERVSQNMFREIFNEYNISFHVPKKDKCVTCTKAENNTDKMNCKEEELLKRHLLEKKATYKRFKVHQNLRTPDNTTVTCSFDLQKVLNTPHGKSMLLYYSRKYSVYNLTMYESGTQEVYCYTWGECDGKRGSNEIATCLLKYLTEIDKRKVKHLLLYCDSCSGQNKNKIVLSAMNYFLKTAINLEIIQVNYLLPGHTYMPVDSVHAVIEREVQKMIVWSPSQWATYFETARKRPRPYNVIVMDHEDFLDFDQLATDTFTSVTLKTLKFKDLRVVTFKKTNPDQMLIKYSMEGEAESLPITLFQNPQDKGKGKGKGKGKVKPKGKKDNAVAKKLTSSQQVEDNATLKPLYYDSRLPIATAKYKDLIRLCDNGTIPKRFHSEYRNLPWHTDAYDTLNQTDEEDEHD